MFRLINIVVFVCLLSSVTDAQIPWKEVSRPTNKLLFRLSFLDSLRGWISGFEGTMLKTTNGGLNWQEQSPGVSTDIHEVFALNDRIVWALSFKHYVDTSTWFGTQILKSTNGGNTWTSEQYPKTAEFFNSIMFKDSLNGWMAGEFGHMVRTTNAGATWIPIQVQPQLYANWAILNVKFLSPLYGYAMGGRIDIIGVVWRTTDGGLNWVASGPSPEPVHDIHFVDSLHIIGIVGDVDFGASMIRTTSGGEQWEYTFLNIFGEPRAMSFRNDREAWVPLGFAAQMMFTDDTANTWTAVDTPLRRPIYDLVFTDSLTGYAVGDSGTILKYNKNPVDVAEEKEVGVPLAFSLRQNYPNPFNPLTTIAFDLPAESFVTLKVFNLMGAEVRTLVEQKKPAGRHLRNFSANDLPSGMYFYRLQTEKTTLTKKMVLLR